MTLLRMTRGDVLRRQIEVTIATMRLASDLEGDESSILVASPIPTDVPDAGILRVTDADGVTTTVTYTGWSGRTFMGCSGVPVADAGAAIVSPTDLTGASLRFTLKSDLADDDGSAILTKLSSVPGELDIDADPATGRATLVIDAADTAAIAITGRRAVLYFDVQVTPSGGDVLTILNGRFIVEADVSRTSP